MADAFVKANKTTIERYLPGWYRNSPLIMLALSFGAMQMAAIEWEKKPPRVRIEQHVVDNNRTVPVPVPAPPNVEIAPPATAPSGGVQHGV
jgi:hypothetical protein